MQRKDSMEDRVLWLTVGESIVGESDVVGYCCCMETEIGDYEAKRRGGERISERREFGRRSQAQTVEADQA